MKIPNLFSVFSIRYRYRYRYGLETENSVSVPKKYRHIAPVVSNTEIPKMHSVLTALLFWNCKALEKTEIQRNFSAHF